MDRIVSRDSDDVKVLKEQISDYDAVVEEAREASQLEQTMTLMQGIKLYPAAIAWSVLLSTAIVMEGYGELKTAKARSQATLPGRDESLRSGLPKVQLLVGSQSGLICTDTALLGNFYAYPTFKQKYGTQLADGT